MTKAEMILAAKLMKLAADEFGNHGSNDMPDDLVAHIGLHDRDLMAARFNSHNNSVADPWDFRHIGDSAWMTYLAERLMQAAGEMR